MGDQPGLSLPSRGMCEHISQYFGVSIKGEGLHLLCRVIKDQKGSF